MGATMSTWPLNDTPDALAVAKQKCEERAKASLAAAKGSIPGGTICSIVAMPMRILVWLLFMLFLFPLFMTIGFWRALYIRGCIGKPSKALEYATRCNNHAAGMYYPCMMLFDAPFEEERLRKAFVELCLEDGIKEEVMELV